MDSGNPPRVTPFCRADNTLDLYTLVTITQPLFRHVPDPNATQNILVKRSDIPSIIFPNCYHITH